MTVPEHTREEPDPLDRSIVAARGGSYSALGQLFDHYRAYLMRIANDELGNDLGALLAPSDVVQSTFLNATKEFGHFQGVGETQLRGWLRRILINNIHDARRKYAATNSQEESLGGDFSSGDAFRELVADCSAPSAALRGRENQDIVHAAMARLADESRRAIELRSFDGRTFEEVGAALGRSAEAARKIWCRAIDRLAVELATHHGNRSGII